MPKRINQLPHNTAPTTAALIPLMAGGVTAYSTLAELLASAVDSDGAIRIGTSARLLPVTNGFKFQVSGDAGTTWQDGPSYTAD